MFSGMKEECQADSSFSARSHIRPSAAVPWPIVPVEERVVEVAEDVCLCARLHPGRGVPFLLVHGLASNARLWDGVAEALAEAGHTVVAVDQRGHGRSSKPDSGYDFATVVADLVALIGTLGLDRPVAVGQSWGGNVVLELGATNAHTVTAVVAVDGGFIELGSKFRTWDDCCRALTPPRLAGTPAERMRDWMRSAHADWPQAGIDGAMANFEVRADGTIAPWLTLDRHLMILRELYGHRPSERYPHVRVPALLVPADTGDVAWTHDKRAAVDAALAALPDGRAHWFSPADHDIHAQYPAELAAVLTGFAHEVTRR
jgi:pimeloyl-ACP methyl ester carboxylesterase